MSEFKEGDILECVDDVGSCGLKVGQIYPFNKYDSSETFVFLKGMPEFNFFKDRFIKVGEKDMDAIKLTYAEAWEALKEGKEVYYSSYPCKLGNLGLITSASEGYVEFSTTDKLFTMKKEPDYKVCGLHDGLVEIEVFGLKTYQERRSEKVYLLNGDGFVCSSSFNYRLDNLRVKLKGDYTKAKIRVTVSEDKQIIYEHL